LEYRGKQSTWSRISVTFSRAGRGFPALPSIAPAERRRSFTSVAHRKAGIWQGVLKIRALYEATYFAGLRKAGMPEE
jgi:hypothetical protein